MQLNNPNEIIFPIRSINIYRFQEKIDWKALKNDKVRFVFIKATKGKDYRDLEFNENCNDSNQK